MVSGTTLLDSLRQHDVLDEYEVAHVRAAKVRHKRNEILLDFISRTSKEQYEKFLECLLESKQVHVYNQLQSEHFNLWGSFQFVRLKAFDDLKFFVSLQ